MQCKVIHKFGCKLQVVMYIFLVSFFLMFDCSAFTLNNLSADFLYFFWFWFTVFLQSRLKTQRKYHQFTWKISGLIAEVRNYFSTKKFLVKFHLRYIPALMQWLHGKHFWSPLCNAHNRILHVLPCWQSMTQQQLEIIRVIKKCIYYHVQIYLFQMQYTSSKELH